MVFTFPLAGAVQKKSTHLGLHPRNLSAVGMTAQIYLEFL